MGWVLNLPKYGWKRLIKPTPRAETKCCLVVSQIAPRFKRSRPSRHCTGKLCCFQPVTAVFFHNKLPLPLIITHLSACFHSLHFTITASWGSRCPVSQTFSAPGPLRLEIPILASGAINHLPQKTSPKLSQSLTKCEC